MIALEELKTFRDVLRHGRISRKDKLRLLECHRKVQTYGDDWIEMRGKTSFGVGGKIYIYRVNEDRTVNYIETLDNDKYCLLSFDTKF